MYGILSKVPFVEVLYCKITMFLHTYDTVMSFRRRRQVVKSGHGTHKFGVGGRHVFKLAAIFTREYKDRN